MCHLHEGSLLHIDAPSVDLVLQQLNALIAGLYLLLCFLELPVNKFRPRCLCDSKTKCKMESTEIHQAAQVFPRYCRPPRTDSQNQRHFLRTCASPEFLHSSAQDGVAGSWQLVSNLYTSPSRTPVLYRPSPAGYRGLQISCGDLLQESQKLTHLALCPNI